MYSNTKIHWSVPWLRFKPNWLELVWRHVPLLLTLDIDIQLHNSYEREFKPIVAWHKCDEVIIGKYKSKLDQKLLQINPTHEAWGCKNHKCTYHYEFIQSQYSNLINLWLKASNDSLPHTTNNMKKGIK